MSSPKVLITGGSGFLGSHAVDTFLSAGFDVAATTRRGQYRVNEFASLHVCDLTNTSELKDLVRRHEPGAIVHLAALANHDKCVAEPTRCFSDNFDTTLSVLEVARELAVPRVVIASSNVVYGTESPYRAGKLASELAAEAYCTTYSLSCLCLRFANLYGEDRKDGLVTVALNAKLNSRPLTVYGDPRARRDYIHVDDACQALLLAVNSKANGVFDICSGYEVAIADIVRWLQLTIDARPARSTDALFLPQSTVDQVRVLGFKPKIKLMEWIRERVRSNR